MGDRIAAGIRGFFPGYFAMVMATGIVSLAAHASGLEELARALVVVNLAAYPTLWAITLLRLWLYPRELAADFRRHDRGPTFLTMVAGTSVLGGQLVAIHSAPTAGFVLWLLAVVLWTVLLYLFFAAMTVAEAKPGLEAGIHGAWLLVVVATESLCVLGTMVAPGRPGAELIVLVSLSAYLVGAMLYVLLMGLILHRWLFFNLPADRLTPPYWINMGALAIATLAGSRLLLMAHTWPMLGRIAAFLEGFTLFFWANATWWIPLLLMLGFWRHVLERVPIIYDPQYWSLVFPLGMYTVATSTLVQATGLEPLAPIPRVFVWAALGAWLLTAVGLLRSLAGALSAANDGAPPKR